MSVKALKAVMWSSKTIESFLNYVSRQVVLVVLLDNSCC